MPPHDDRSDLQARLAELQTTLAALKGDLRRLAGDSTLSPGQQELLLQAFQRFPQLEGIIFTLIDKMSYNFHTESTSFKRETGQFSSYLAEGTDFVQRALDREQIDPLDDSRQESPPLDKFDSDSRE